MNLLNSIEHAAKRLAPYLNETSLERSTALSELAKANVYLKNEHCQKTGSFKIRGALNKILLASEQKNIKGIVCASAGNHGIGVAFASRLLKIRPVIFLPKTIDPLRLKKIESYGAQVKFVEGDCYVAEACAREYGVKNDLIYISPYNDLDVIAGQGTIGLEIGNQLSSIDTCYVSVGGGGLISGIGCSLQDRFKHIEMIGCSPKRSAVMANSFETGTILPDKGLDTLSDSTAGGVEPDSITVKLCQQYVKRFNLMTETQIIKAMCYIAQHEGWIIEGAAAVAVAAMLKDKEHLIDKNVVIVLCGRNINFDTYTKAVHESI